MPAAFYQKPQIKKQKLYFNTLKFNNRREKKRHENMLYGFVF